MYGDGKIRINRSIDVSAMVFGNGRGTRTVENLKPVSYYRGLKTQDTPLESFDKIQKLKKIKTADEV